MNKDYELSKIIIKLQQIYDKSKNDKIIEIITKLQDIIDEEYDPYFHLCDFCVFDYPECNCKNIKFGCEKGYNNIYRCNIIIEDTSQ